MDSDKDFEEAFIRLASDIKMQSVIEEELSNAAYQ